MANTIIEVILEISFLIFSNINIQFAEKELILRFYTTEKALPTFQRIKFIDKKEFAKIECNKNVEAFVVYMASFISKMMIYVA